MGETFRVGHQVDDDDDDEIAEAIDPPADETPPDDEPGEAAPPADTPGPELGEPTTSKATPKRRRTR